MTIEEMQSRLDHTNFNPTNEDWEKITLVYNYHPAIDGIDPKGTIAELYKIGGMALINDMLPRARTIENHLTQMNAIRNQIEELSYQLNELSSRYDVLKRINK